MTKRIFRTAVATGALALTVGLAACGGGDETASSDGVIEGTVTSGADKPEAGVWVIAQTDDTPTPLRKIVVTDDAGKYVLPELPDAEYDVWVRGYGIKDSAKSTAKPGSTVDISAEAATGRDAARVYPANYWLSLFKPTQAADEWVGGFKLGCELCHQMGAAPTRLATSKAFEDGMKKAGVMHGTAQGLGGAPFIASLTDWGKRIADGEVPEAPPRPEGAERNMVITQWEWGDQFTYAHDEITTDKRDPTLNANGKVFGVDLANDRMLEVDPRTNTASETKVPTRDGWDTPWCEQNYKAAPGAEGVEQKVEDGGFGTLGCPVAGGESAFKGKYHNPANPHNPMMDKDGKIWITTQIRREWGEDLNEKCKKDPVIANNQHHRQLGVYDPDTKETTLIDTCFGTHHLQFDDKGILWLSGDSFVLGWFDPSKWDPEKPETEMDAQEWAEVKVDSDGDGTADKPIVGFNYGIIPNPADGSVWTAQPSTGSRGVITRFDPATKTFEAYAPPAPGHGPRGVDIDSKGIIWAAMGGSGHLAKFDRSKCKQTWGEGDQCPEGWTFYRSPGPLFQGVKDMGTDFHYYLYVDQHDTLGMGKDTVMLNGTGSDSILAFDQTTEKFTTIRIPHPLNVFTRGLDGRIDDPDTGWKGRGLWFTNGLDPLIHSEVQRSFVAKIQMRPDPLAK